MRHPPIHHHIAKLYVFWPIGITELIQTAFENSSAEASIRGMGNTVTYCCA